jgi:hypothetical protein
MNNPLKILPILIILPILAHISCTSSDLPELPQPANELSSSSEYVSSSSSSSIDVVWCVVGSSCQYVPKNACDAFSGTPVPSCPVSSSSSGNILSSSSSNGNAPSTVKYCYNTLGYNECIIIGIINAIDYYWLGADDCIADGGAVVERAWCIESGYLVIDE